MIGRRRRRGRDGEAVRLLVDVVGHPVAVELDGLPELEPDLAAWLGATPAPIGQPAWSPDVVLRRVVTGDGHLVAVDPVGCADCDERWAFTEHADLHGVLVALCDALELVALGHVDAPALHAAVLGDSGAAPRAVVVLGASGAGKSTLAAHLGAGGLAHGTDELAVVDDAGRVDAFERPLHLRPPTYGPADDPHGPDPERWLRGGSRFDLHRPVDHLGAPVPVGLVVVLDRDGTTVPSLAPRTRAATMRALFEHSFNLRTLSWERLARLATIARGADGLTLRYEEASAAAGPVIARLGEVDRASSGRAEPAPLDAPATVAGHAGRAWWFEDSLLVVAGDRRHVASIGAHDLAPPQAGRIDLPAALRAELDDVLGAGW